MATMENDDVASSESFKKPTEDELERAHFKRIVNAYKCYKKYSLRRVDKTEEYLKHLPENHRNLLTRYGKHLQQVRVGIEHNDEIVKLIIKDVSDLFENVSSGMNGDNGFIDINSLQPVSTMDMEKVQSTIKQFVRDWSSEGKEERFACYQPILNELVRLFPAQRRKPEGVKVLVPGAGLGRLAYEVAKLGYSCQGNEFSLFMLFASNFVLNKCTDTNIFKIYPWVHQNCNHMKGEDQIRSVNFPDVDPTDLPQNAQFSMAAGDFLEIYQDLDAWDSVLTCFFLDTANNIVAYIETLWNILKPGGYWINFGPLLYHFADVPRENSIEPCYEEIVDIIKAMGFVFVKEETDIPTSYSQNPRSMLKYEYRCVFFVCQKPL